MPHRAGPCLWPLALLLAGCGRAPEPTPPPVPTTTDELRQALETIRDETKTPGLGVVLVAKDDFPWSAYLGLADRAADRPVTPQTLFRAGSISKTVTSLALLQLVEAGKVRLDDRLADLLPDVAFANRWEETDPVRLVHLLEHTAGWDDISLREFAASVPGADLRESAAFDPSPRTSRWRPGRFFSYSNADYTVAGCAVEKASGKTFDAYVAEAVLGPLEMASATFLLTDAAKANLAQGYDADGVTAVAYEHILGRSSGALNVTPAELAHVVQMFLNRGTFRGKRVVSAASLDRMETPSTSLAARRGVRHGYGLANDTTSQKGFHFHGHGGAMQGFLAMIGYEPTHGVGYVVMVNGDGRDVMDRCDKLLRDYLSRDWAAPDRPTATVPADRLAAHAGYYQPYTPRFEAGRFLERLLGVRHVAVADGSLQIARATGKPTTLLPVDDAGAFRTEDDPDASVVFVEDEGETFLVGMRGSHGLRRVPAWQILGERTVAIVCLALMASAVLFALFWVPAKLFGYLRGVPHLSVRVLPLAAVLSVLAAFALFFGGVATRPIERFGNPTVWSVGFCVLTAAFAVLTVAGLVQAVRARGWEMSRWVSGHALLVSVANVVVLGYLAYWGLIGLRTWA